MTKGRPVDPTRAKRGTGHRPQAGKKKPVEIVPLPAVPLLPSPPDDLPATMHEVWTTAVAEMSGNGHLREVDLQTLKMYCEALYNHAQASANIHQYGLLVKGPHGPMPNPMLRVQKDAAATALRMSDALGLNVLARIRAGLMQIAGQSLLASVAAGLDAGVK